MNVFTSWTQRRAEKRTKRRAKAQSDEIDRQLQEESKLCRQKHDILLISSSFPLLVIWMHYRTGWLRLAFMRQVLLDPKKKRSLL